MKMYRELYSVKQRVQTKPTHVSNVNNVTESPIVSVAGTLELLNPPLLLS